MERKVVLKTLREWLEKRGEYMCAVKREENIHSQLYLARFSFRFSDRIPLDQQLHNSKF
jgi:hypothetical protein